MVCGALHGNSEWYFERIFQQDGWDFLEYPKPTFHKQHDSSSGTCLVDPFGELYTITATEDELSYLRSAIGHFELDLHHSVATGCETIQ